MRYYRAVSDARNTSTPVLPSIMQFVQILASARDPAVRLMSFINSIFIIAESLKPNHF